MAELFISHASPDAPLATRVDDALVEKRISCWIAPRDILSGDYAKAINEAISECKALAVIVSKHAQGSEHVLREVSLAASRRKKIFPLVFDTYRPTEGLEYNLAGLQLIDCSAERFDQAMDHVAAVVGGTPSSRPSPSPPPPSRLFLRGDVFFTALFTVWAIVAAVVPFPIDAIPRTCIVAALLGFPCFRAFAAFRGKGPLIQSAVLFLTIVLTAWILDRAFLRFAVRQTLTPLTAPTNVLYEAPYGDLQDVHLKVSPAVECDPIAPKGAVLFGWGGPVGEITVGSFAAPERLGFRCNSPINLAGISLDSSSRYQLWPAGTIGVIRRIMIVIGGLIWILASFSFWWRHSSARK